MVYSKLISILIVQDIKHTGDELLSRTARSSLAGSVRTFIKTPLWSGKCLRPKEPFYVMKLILFTTTALAYLKTWNTVAELLPKLQSLLHQELYFLSKEGKIQKGVENYDHVLFCWTQNENSMCRKKITTPTLQLQISVLMVHNGLKKHGENTVLFNLAINFCRQYSVAQFNHQPHWRVLVLWRLRLNSEIAKPNFLVFPRGWGRIIYPSYMYKISFHYSRAAP